MISAAVNLPDWPAMLSVEEAARYLGMSVDSFEHCVDLGRFPGPVSDLPIRRKLWSRKELDASISGQDRPANDKETRRSAWNRRKDRQA